MPQKWRTNYWFHLQDNAPAPRSVLVEDFLSKNNKTAMEHLPTLSWPGDFYLFLRLKSTLKEHRFYNATNNIKNATKELKSLS